MAEKPDEQYSEKEAQRRFMATLKSAVNTPPKPLKDKPKVKAESRTTTAKKKKL